MAAIEYPAGLPCPQTLRNVAAERRLLSDQPARQARAIQRDRAYVEALTFPPMTAAAAAVFDAWWRDDLAEGGAWFAASWPLPQGWVAGVRRFLGAPRWDFVPGGMWQVSATCEVRGRGELPYTTGGAPPPPPPAAYFLDTFTGSAGTLITAHTPDIAPIGFAYADAGSGPNTVLQLGGSGRLITVPVGYGTAGVADASASSPPFALELPFPYTVTFIGRPSDTLDWSVVWVLLSNSDGSYLEITLNRDTGPQYWIGVEMVNNAVGGGYLWQDTASGVAAEHTVSVYVEQTQCTVSFDGVAGAPVDLEGVAVASFDGLQFGVDFDYPADNSYIDRFEVA